MIEVIPVLSLFLDVHVARIPVAIFGTHCGVQRAQIPNLAS
jgi:hypothetical protein